MNPKSLFPEDHIWNTKQAKELWEKLSNLEVFQERPAETMPFHDVDLPAPIGRILTDIGEDLQALPIQAFKNSPELIAPSNRKTHFLSSGTGQVNRSISFFSEDGLQLYRRGAIATFYGVLEKFFPDPLQIPGFSLIPSQSIWPHSSLSQMLEWITDFSEVSRDLSGLTDTTGPVWIFGTGFHFVQLYEAKQQFPLPPGSIVIETGGTKGKTRDVSRDELHDMISSVFGVTPSQIVSEYGMCEIACQAYEWNQPGEDRTFRFPSWVSIEGQDPNGQLCTEGFGALIIKDPLRIDYPWPLRTQDLVSLQHQTFTLIGRVPGSILKGCSLNMEGRIVPKKHSIQEDCNGQNNSPIADIDELPIDGYLSGLIEFLQNPLTLRSLEKEFKSKDIAKWALDDLLKSIPQSEPQFRQALVDTKLEPTLNNWLIILPQTHSIAGLYPLFFGAALGLRLTVRKRKSWTHLEEHFIRFLQRQGADIRTIPASFSLKKNQQPWDAILAFGSDETIDSIRELSSLPVKGFGSFTTLSLISDDLGSEEWSHLRKDMLSLASLGCMSTRGIFIVTDKEAIPLMEHIREQYNKIAVPHLPSDLKLGARHALYDQWQPHLYYSGNADGTQFIWQQFDPNKTLDHYLNLHPHCYGWIRVSKEQTLDLYKWLEKQANIAISSPLSLTPQLAVTPLGNSNINLWNGSHTGEPLFQTRKLKS